MTQQPNQQAQAKETYIIDIFTSITAGAIVTFVKDRDIVKIWQSGNPNPVTIPENTFNQYFSYYKQADIFTAQPEPTPAAKINTEAHQRTKKPQKTVEVVYYASGENSGTYSPLCFIESFPADRDINEKTEKFINWDCNIYVSCDMYKIQKIEVPEWITEQEFLKDYISHKYAFGLAYDFYITLSKEEWSKFKTLSEKYKFFIDEYFKGNTKNEFKKSLRAQIIDWLNSPYDYKRPQPLSPRQFEIAAQYIPLYQVNNISTRIYYSF
jgi:hypothetical protein